MPFIAEKRNLPRNFQNLNSETTAIIRQFLGAAQISEVLPFGTGHINDTYKVASGSGNFLLQKLNERAFSSSEAVMHNIQWVGEYIARQSYPLKNMRPVPAQDGRFWWQDAGGGYWRMFPFFDGTLALDRVETEEQAFEGAKAFGAFAKALGGLPPETLHATIPGFHDGPKRLACFYEVIKRGIPGRLKVAAKEIETLLQHQALFGQIAAAGLPQRIMHHDTKISNVLFDAKTRKAAAVVDLDTVMPGIVLSDFGDMMRTFANAAAEDEACLEKVALRMPIFYALSEGYLSEMGDALTLTEKKWLPMGGRWLTLMQAMRFLADYLEGDVYYKTSNPEHNLVRARSQLALYESMTAQLSGIKIC
jgi:Ser/Thr protein kinase RdoA (MazF antagonist)